MLFASLAKLELWLKTNKHEILTHSFRSSLAGNDWFCYQVNMLNERLLDDIRVVVSVDEVAVIGQPADGEDDHHHDEHLDHLEWEKGQKWN